MNEWILPIVLAQHSPHDHSRITRDLAEVALRCNEQFRNPDIPDDQAVSEFIRSIGKVAYSGAHVMANRDHNYELPDIKSNDELTNAVNKLIDRFDKLIDEQPWRKLPLPDGPRTL